MKARIFYSNHKVLKFALEDIYLQFSQDFFIDSFDFIIFAVSPVYDERDVNKDIQKIFNTNNYIAFNAISSFANDKVIEEGISALFIKFEKDGRIDKFECSCLEDKHNKLFNYLKDRENSLHLLLTTYSEDIINFFEKMQLSNTIIGGVISGERGKLFSDGEIIEKGFIILSFENIDWDFSIATGYKEIGPEWKVRLSKGNKLYVVDYNDASLIAKRLLRGLRGIEDLWYAPLIVKRNGYLVPRTFKEVKDNLYVEFFGDFKNGESVRMSFANSEILLEEDKKQAQHVKNELENVDLVFDFSCIARQYVLEDKSSKELEVISSIVNAPLFGFFTFGEYFLHSNTSILFNQTSLIIGVKE